MNMHNQMPPEAQLTQMLTGCLISQAVYVAAKLGIADLLKDAPQTVTLLAEKTATHERSLYRILRSLASVGIFTETDPRVFALTPLAEPLLSSEAGSFRDVAIFTGENWHWALYGEMLYSVKTGKSACEKIHGMKAFPYLQQNPEAFEIFNRGMSSYSSSVVGINDPRVEPWLSAKLAARLQAATASGKPVLLRIDYDAGHGIGNSRKQVNEEFADMLAFLFEQLGGGVSEK